MTMTWSGYKLSHDTIRDIIALNATQIFGHCVVRKEVLAPPLPSENRIIRKVDLVAVNVMGFPFVRVVEVKTKLEDLYSAINYIEGFRELGLANFYYIGYPKSVINALTDYSILYERNLGLIIVDEKSQRPELVIRPRFAVRRTDWELLYRELDKSLAARLRRTLGKTPLEKWG